MVADQGWRTKCGGRRVADLAWRTKGRTWGGALSGGVKMYVYSIGRWFAFD